ncbi:MAG: metal ABC transporter ATP-binding protein [Actinomycetota bacterium]
MAAPAVARARSSACEDHRKGCLIASTDPSAIVAKNASIAFDRKMVWSELNIAVPRGSFTAILGPNGAGKSTLLKAILGVQKLTSGTLHVLGQQAGRSRSRIGYVPQHSGFDRSVNIRALDVVKLGADGDRWGIPLPGASRKTVNEKVRAVIDLVEASAYAEAAVGTLSGGEQQRLLIAQALVRDPEILLLDEPLDNLDLSSQQTVSSLLQRVCRTNGATVVIVAHDVNPILSYLDHVVYIAAGSAVSGPPREIITSETLSALYKTDIEVLRASDGRLVVVGQPEAPAFHSERHES